MWDALPCGTTAGGPLRLICGTAGNQRAERANNKEIGLTELFSAEILHLNARQRRERPTEKGSEAERERETAV